MELNQENKCINILKTKFKMKKAPAKMKKAAMKMKKAPTKMKKAPMKLNKGFDALPKTVQSKILKKPSVAKMLNKAAMKMKKK